MDAKATPPATAPPTRAPATAAIAATGTAENSATVELDRPRLGRAGAGESGYAGLVGAQPRGILEHRVVRVQVSAPGPIERQAAAGGVREVRYPIGAHALRELEQLGRARALLILATLQLGFRRADIGPAVLARSGIALPEVALDDPHTSPRTWRSTAEELLVCNDEQTHLIEALLTLASSESGLDDHERTDLATICRTVLARARPDIDDLGLRVDSDTRPAQLDGDPGLIERLVANLVDNAVNYNTFGGHVRISTDTTDGTAVLTVTNTGPVIPTEAIDRLFQPFQRLDPRRTHHKGGHGLGLAIVKAIASTHGAIITARPQTGGGLSVTVTFPPPTSANTDPGRTSRPRRLAPSRA